MVEVVIPAGMKPWHGGDSAPADWDGGAVLYRGTTLGVRLPRTIDWKRGVDRLYDTDIIAYTPRADAKVGERERVTDLIHEMQASEQYTAADLADAIHATLRAGGEVREVESLTYAVQHNPNCPSPYLVRLPRGVIDFAPPHQTSDALGYGKTFAEAFHAARAALAPAAGGEGL